MKRLTITRDATGDQGTFGKGVLREAMNVLFACEFIELPWRGNAPGLSCVPAGIYPAHVITSPHFRRAVYLVAEIPGRDLCEIHPANWAGDASKGWFSQLRGCCSPGLARATMAPVLLDGTHLPPQASVTSSSHALDELMEATAQEPIEVEFAWAEGLNPEVAP